MPKCAAWMLIASVNLPAANPQFTVPSPNLQISSNSVAHEAFSHSVIGNRADDELVQEQRAPAADPRLFRFTPNLAERQRSLAAGAGAEQAPGGELKGV
jgi:hypothetical protein